MVGGGGGLCSLIESSFFPLAPFENARVLLHLIFSANRIYSAQERNRSFQLEDNGGEKERKGSHLINFN